MAPHELNIVHHRGVIFQKGCFIVYSEEFVAIFTAIFYLVMEGLVQMKFIVLFQRTIVQKITLNPNISNATQMI